MRKEPANPWFEPLEPRCPLAGDLAGVAAPTLHADQWSADAWAHDLDWIRDEFGLTGAGQTVAIIDSGIAYDHVALGGGWGTSHRVVGGWDFAERDADPYDDAPAGFHGTHVAGIIGSTDETYGGVAPEVDLVALRVFDDQGASSFAWIEEALAWVDDHRFAFAHPITTVNLSLGSAIDQLSSHDLIRLEDDLAQLKSKGIFIAVSAGNEFEGTVELTYPAASEHVIPVASVGATGTLSSFSQRDPRVLAAPGEWITSTVPDYLFGFDGRTDDFFSVSGTSAAAPHVAAASALVREALMLAGDASVTQDEIEQVFRTTADPVFDPVTQASYQRVNLKDALEAALPADDHADQLPLATTLGPIAHTRTWRGTLGRLGDIDTFALTPTRDGQMTISVPDGTGFQINGAATSSASGVLTLDVSAGEEVRFGIRSEVGVGHYTAVATLTPTSVSSIPAVPGGGFTESHLRWIPTQSGSYQVNLAFDDPQAVSDVALYNGDHAVVFSTQAPGAHESFGVWVSAVQAYELVVRGRHTDVTFEAFSTSVSSPTGSERVPAVLDDAVGTMSLIRALAKSPLPRPYVEEAIDALFAELLAAQPSTPPTRPQTHAGVAKASIPRSSHPPVLDAMPRESERSWEGIDVVFADEAHRDLAGS